MTIPKLKQLKVSEDKVEFKEAKIKNKAFDKQYYLDLIVKSIKQHKSLSRKDVDELLWNKLPEWMDDKQRKRKVGNLLSELRINEVIKNDGTYKNPKWVFRKTPI